MQEERSAGIRQKILNGKKLTKAEWAIILQEVDALLEQEPKPPWLIEIERLQEQLANSQRMTTNDFSIIVT